MKIGSQAHSVQRSPLVDAVRGISILLVMLFHFDMYYHLQTCLLVKALHLQHVVTLITRNGYFGVTMFFVIIRSVLHRARNGAPADWERLYPSPDSSFFTGRYSASFVAWLKKLRALSVSSDSHPVYVDCLGGFETQSGCLFPVLAVSVSGDCLCRRLFDFPILV